MSRYAKKTVEHILEILILKFLSNFSPQQTGLYSFLFENN